MGSSDNNNRIELHALLNILYQTQKFFNFDKNLLEIGSMNGHDAFLLSTELKIDHKNVFIVEANPFFAKKIALNYPSINLKEAAIAKTTGKVDFYAAKDEDDGRSSTYDRDIYEADNFEKITVSSLSGKDLLQQFNLDKVFAVKIDVEGAAYDVIESFGEKLDDIFCIQVETERSQVWKNQTTKDDVFNLLNKKGYELIWECDVGIQNDSVWLNKRFA